MKPFMCGRCTIALTILGATLSFGQAPGTASPGRGVYSSADQAAPVPPVGQPLLSPPASASIRLEGKKISVNYGSPSRRGRKIMGELVSYGKVWRTGANAATSFVTAGDLLIGSTRVPAGRYTLYTLTSAPDSGEPWMLIINRQTGQWGTVYDSSQDLARIPMQAAVLTAPQEAMTITFKKDKNGFVTMHIKWESVDEFVTLALGTLSILADIPATQGGSCSG